MQRIYLDHNATTPVHPAVLEAMLPYFGAEFGNPSSVHQFGQRAGHAIEQARESVAALIGARSSEIVFTSGGTEADNAAIFGVIGHALRARKRSSATPPHLITTVIEHDAVLNSCRALDGRGISVTCIPVDAGGIVSPDAIRAAIRPETALISVMYANNEIGTLQPIEEIAQEIAKIAAEARIPLHTDAVQAAGKVAIDVNRLGVQLLSLSAHKFCGPKGAGALFVRKTVEIEPLLHGGPNERRRRAGTENVAGIVGLGKAAELARRDLAETSARMAELRDRLEKGLLAAVPGARVNGDPVRRIPNTCNLLLPGAESESLLIALDLAGLACSAGAACSSGAVDPSHVLTAIGLTPAEARASVRLSVGRGTTPDEIDRVLELIPAAVARQRGVSKPSEMAAQ
jgi:cysteine desulfurase